MNKYGIKTQGLSTVALFAFVLFAAGLSVAEGTTTYRCPAITDAGLDQRDNGTSFGDATMLKLAGDPAGAEVVRSIIRFSVPSFVGAAQVQSAILHLYAVEPGSVTVDVYALEKYFYEWGVDFSRNIYMGATWLIPGGKGSAPAGWDTAGGDYDIGVSASGSVGDGWSSIDVTGLVTGNFDKVRWYGMLLKLGDETADDFQSVYSRQEEESEDLAPYLELTVDLGLASNVYMCPVAGDVYLDEENDDKNFDHKTRIMVATDTINHYGLGRGLIKFEISSEITAFQIDNATVHMMTTDSTGEGGEVNLAALNVAFDEDAATWSSMGDGAEDTENMASGTTPGENSTAFTLDVTGLLQNKLDKVRDYGTMLLFDDEYQTPSVHENIYTREAYGPGTVGPYLKIKLARPDFVVSAASAEWYDADDASQGYAVNYTLYNQGAGLGGNSMLCLWVDENAAVDLDCPQLSAGGSLSGLFSGPFVVAGDNDTLLLCANGGAACDGFDTLQEDNETNNCYAFVVEPPPHPGIPTSTTSVSGNDNDVNNGDNPGGDNSNGRPPATTTTSVIPVTTTTTTVNEPDVATTTTTVAELPAPVTTTTTTPVGRCFLRKVLPDEDASVLNMFRQFRDRRLLSSPAGRRLVADYYAHGTEIMKILQADATLRVEVRRLVWVLAPAVAADMQSGEAIRLTALQYAAFVDILARMRPRASAALQAMIDEMREKIYAGELFEWAGLRSAYAAE